MEIIYVGESEDSRQFIRGVLSKGNFALKEVRNISDEDLFNMKETEIILITDDFHHFKHLEKASYSLGNVIKVFLANTFNDPFLKKLIRENKDLMLSYKARDLLNLVKVLSRFKDYSSIDDLIPDISIYDYPIVAKFRKKVSGDLKSVSRDTLVYISDFVKDHNLDEFLDRDNIIIAVSEVIDNIIELYINKGLVVAEVLIDIRISESVFGVTIFDLFGEANIYDISNSISIPLEKASELFVDEFPKERGRGYTLIRKTADRVVTVIVRHDSYHKYFFDSPCTSVTLVYYLTKKESDGRLNTVIEFS